MKSLVLRMPDKSGYTNETVCRSSASTRTVMTALALVVSWRTLEERGTVRLLAKSQWRCSEGILPFHVEKGMLDLVIPRSPTAHADLVGAGRRRR